MYFLPPVFPRTSIHETSQEKKREKEGQSIRRAFPLPILFQMQSGEFLLELAFMVRTRNEDDSREEDSDEDDEDKNVDDGKGVYLDTFGFNIEFG